MPRDWFDYSTQVLTALGSLGTVGAFIFLFFRDKNREAQLEELRKVAKATERQFRLDRTRNRLSFLPWLFVEKVLNDGNTVKYIIRNSGRSVHIRKLDSKINGYRMELRAQTFDFHTNTAETFDFMVGSASEKDVNHKLIHIYFKDQVGYYYDSVLLANFNSAKMLYPKLLSKKRAKELGLNVEELDQKD